MIVADTLRIDEIQVIIAVLFGDKSQYGLELEIREMLKVCALWKAAAVDPRSDFAKVDGKTITWRRWERIFKCLDRRSVGGSRSKRRSRGI